MYRVTFGPDLQFCFTNKIFLFCLINKMSIFILVHEVIVHLSKHNVYFVFSILNKSWFEIVHPLVKI